MALGIRDTKVKNSKTINTLVSFSREIVKAMATTSQIMDNKYMVYGKMIQESITSTLRNIKFPKNLAKKI